jgi:uncharacterized protein (UPF0332 family)
VDRQARLAGARQALAGARRLLAHADFRGGVSRCYYAAYQAMWAAVGEPEKKPRWEHLGLITTFVRGRWFDPRVGFRGPGVFELQRFALLRLYDLRLKADYRLEDIRQEEAQWAVQTTQEIITIAEQKDTSDATPDKEV